MGQNLLGVKVDCKKLSYKGLSTSPIKTFPEGSEPGNSTGCDTSSPILDDKKLE